MSIAIVIGTHGASAEQLFKTTEMILGAQNNVAWVNFLPNENTETLIKKYNNCLKNLDTTVGVLFLVDTWGGSPFNAASQIVTNKDNYEVITGVNIPMLIETFMVRDDNFCFQELISIIIKTGRIGIKTLKTKELDHLQITKKTNFISTPSNREEHMHISLARIDDRLIHGQIVTRWIKEINVKRIIVINDKVAEDVMRKTLLVQVAPPGITVHVIDILKAIRVYNNPKYANDRVMFLFTNPSDIVSLVENNVVITSVNIGGMAYSHDKIQVSDAVSINASDIEAFKKLNKLGIELEVRKVPGDSPIKMMDLIKKINN